VILPILTGVFLLIAVGLVLYARGLIRSGKLSLPATMAELKSDRDMLL
jgi:sulfite exporter TauE/SafE